MRRPLPHPLRRPCLQTLTLLKCALSSFASPNAFCPCNLSQLTAVFVDACIQYEPELFPGLIYRMVQPKIVLLIFVSGKVVLTGGKVRKEIYHAFEQIYPVLQEFRK